MKKRIFSLILALAMLCALLPQAALTASAEVYSGSCGAEGDNLTWSLDTTTGLLTITGSGEMADYFWNSGAPWYKFHDSITDVSLPEGLISIGSRAFYGCSSLTGVTIPDSVTSIGDLAFYACSSLTSVTIPTGVTSIGEGAFERCSSLTSVTIPASVTSIGWSAFSHCDALTAIDVSAGNPNYDSVNGVLFNKAQTELIQYPAGKPDASYQIPASVISIGEWAFSGCSALTSVTIPDSVTSIGEYAFYYCTALTSVTIPNSVTSIGEFVFSGCSSLTSVTIPDSVTSIGDRAFYGCKALTSVTIPDSVTSIGNGAFSGCSALTSVIIGNGVTDIGEYAFYYCTALTGVTIPDSVTSIGERAFYGCSALTGVTIGNGVTSIGYGVFSNCSSLTSVTIPASVTSIGDKAFGYYYDYGYQKIDGFTIYGYPGSAAETYATENGFRFFAADRFADVNGSDYFFNPVMWAVAQDPPITSGVAPGQFGPHNPCTREQIVTFLWAANGKPTPAGTGSGFSDVAADAWYYKPVMWAVENKITSGMPDGSFGVGQPCTRAQAMTFLWASKGKPAPASMESTFSDVSTGNWFCKAILWAAENGITKGVGNGLFGVNNTCTRAQIITFLYKAYN